AAVSITETVENQLSRGPQGTVVDQGTIEGMPCGEIWAHYCGEMYEAMKVALADGKRILMVTQPYMTSAPDAMEKHLDQQKQLRAFLHQKFGDDPRLHFANLG